MRVQTFISSLVGAVLALSTCVFGVDRLVPGGYLTIQAGIDAAGPGDTVIIAPGLYTGVDNRDLDFGGKVITVTGSNAGDWDVVADTVIDCEGSGRGFYFHSGEGGSSVLAGVTITNGSATAGGAVLCEGSSPSINNCLLSDNSAEYGGAIENDNSSPAVSSCIFTGNSADWCGGGIDNYNGSAPDVSNCIFSGNGAYWGGGIFNDSASSPTITNCTFSGNSATGTGGAMDLMVGSATVVANCILWGDSASTGAEINGAATVSYSDIEGGYGGTGNINDDPCFVDAAGEDYYLVFGSPCVDSGTNSPAGGLPATDIEGVSRPLDGDGDLAAVADMGAHEYVVTEPLIGLSTFEIDFQGGVGAANPPDQVLSVTNVGEGTLDWQISEACGWLSVDPVSGSSSGEANEVTLSVDISGLGEGDYNCELTVWDANAENSPQIVAVALSIRAPDGLHVPLEYSTIQAAIDAAAGGDTVIIALGVYTGPGNTDLDFGGKAITVRSTDPEDPAVVAATIINCEGFGGDIGLFRFHSGEGRDSVVAGLTITNSTPSTEEFRQSRGIYCSASSPTIRNCVITNHTAQLTGAFGGGIYCELGSGPAIVGCTISSNKAVALGSEAPGTDGEDGCGGGIYCSSDSYAVIENCTIADNEAWGGHSGPAWPEDPQGRGGRAGGGGVYGNVSINNCVISGNLAFTYAPYHCNGGNCEGGGIFGEVTVTNSTITDNIASASSSTWSDSGSAYGGGIYCLPGSQIVNCLMTGNTSAASDPVPRPEIYSLGAGIYGSNMNVDNCTISNNSAIMWWEPDTEVGGVYCMGTTGITDSIVWGNEGKDMGGDYSVTYSCIGEVVAGVGNIFADPAFVSGPEGDFYLSQIAAGQGVDSPCVDAGGDSAWILGMDIHATRTDEIGDAGIVDMGYHYPASLPGGSPDINGDGEVDLFDVAIMGSQWEGVPGVPSADIAPPGGDGVVNGLDLRLLADYWLWGK